MPDAPGERLLYTEYTIDKSFSEARGKRDVRDERDGSEIG
jgi:hypothetical protein